MRNRATAPLIRGFEFKSFTRWVKVYSGIHGLGCPLETLRARAVCTAVRT